MTDIPLRELYWHTRTSHLTDRDLLALVLWGEARGEPIAGQVAIACVIRNRVALGRFGLGYRGVILRRRQFSCFWEPESSNTQRVVAMVDAWKAAIAGGVINTQAWVADGVLSGLVPDATGGADHYLTSVLFDSDKCPRWAKKMAHTVTLGHHVFLKERAAA